MNIVDANVLLYAANSDSPQHEASRRWLERSLSGGARVGLTWIAMLAFVRISTTSMAFPKPISAQQAMHSVQEWIAAPSSEVVGPTGRHADVLLALLEATGTRGNLVSDAHLAALAVEHRARVITYDRDFDRFPNVTAMTPDQALI